MAKNIVAVNERIYNNTKKEMKIIVKYKLVLLLLFLTLSIFLSFRSSSFGHMKLNHGIKSSDIEFI
jgi:hypothetical protein